MTMKMEPNENVFSKEEFEYAFPDVDPGVTPVGSRVLLQIRRPKTRTKGGIILTSDVQEVEKWNTSVGKVISIGPLSFMKRDTMTPWPEGAWCRPGDFVRFPKYGGDRWEVPVDNEEPALFVICNDHEIIGLVKPGNELKIKAFV